MAAETEGKPPQISPERKILPIPIGVSGRGSWGDDFAPSIGGEGHRRWPDWSGDGGGDLEFARELEEERRLSEGAGLGRLTDPDPSRSGLTEPGGLVWPNGPKPI
jgi:hypothetical protein